MQQSAIQSVEVEQEETANEVILPIVEAGAEENADTSAQDQAFQDTEQETPNAEIAESSLDEIASDPEQENKSLADADSQQEETDPASSEAGSSPSEELVQEPKPTPRGNELVATNPSTVKLSSGGLQLVELFAFW
jgi:hypothetical protein